MLTTVAGDKSAIGYASLGSLDDTVKVLKIDGTEAEVLPILKPEATRFLVHLTLLPKIRLVRLLKISSTLF